MGSRCVPIAGNIDVYDCLCLLEGKLEVIFEILGRKWDGERSPIGNVVMANTVDPYNIVDAQPPAFLQVQRGLSKANRPIRAFQPIIDAVPPAENDFIDSRSNK